MPRDYINIGPAPCDESCAQVGVGYYYYTARSLIEGRAFINQLRRVLGPEPEGAELRTKLFPHDSGSYREVVCYYDTTLPKSQDYAFRCEDQAPDHWDDEARAELGAAYAQFGLDAGAA